MESTLLKRDDINIALSDDRPGYLNPQQWRKLDHEASYELVNLLQNLPGLASKLSKEQTYKVVFPKNTPDHYHLLKKSNGHYQATIVDEKNRFYNNAELVDMSYDRIVASVFEILSIATQQYYLHEINQQMTRVCEKLDQVLDFLYTDKACELYAEAQRIQEIYENYGSIMRHPEQRLTALQKILQVKTLSERDTQFYMRDINRLADHPEKEVERLRDDLNSYTQTLGLYGICAALEIMLTQNYDASYLSYVEKDLKRHYDEHNMNIAKLKGTVGAKIQALKEPKPGILGIVVAAPNVSPQLNAMQEDINQILGEQSPVKNFEDTVQKIKAAITEPAEYRITGEGEVYQKI